MDDENFEDINDNLGLSEEEELIEDDEDDLLDDIDERSQEEDRQYKNDL